MEKTEAEIKKTRAQLAEVTKQEVPREEAAKLAKQIAETKVTEPEVKEIARNVVITHRVAAAQLHSKPVENKDASKFAKKNDAQDKKADKSKMAEQKKDHEKDLKHAQEQAKQSKDAQSKLEEELKAKDKEIKKAK